MTGYRIAEVGERLVGTGAAEATVALSSLLEESGHTVRLFGADSINVPDLADYEVFGEWSKLYRLVESINDDSHSAADRDVKVTEYHTLRRDSARRLVAAIRRFDPDVIHVHNVAATLSHLAVLWMSFEWPLIWTLHDRFAFDMFHNEWEVDSGLVRTWEKTVAGGVSFLGRDLLAASSTPIDFVTPSEWLRDLAESSPLGRLHRFHVIRNVVSDVIPDSAMTTDQLRSALDVDHVLLAVIPRPDYSLKGFDVAREAFLRARALLSQDRETKDVRLGLLVTTSSDLGLAEWGIFTLKDLHERGITGSSRYLGQGVMRDLYASVDAAVIASRVENLPNVAIEAIRDRCPVIATDVGGVGEIGEDGEIGRLVPPESVSGMAEAMVEVVVRRGRAHYADRLEHVWESSFAPRVVLRDFESVMQQAVDKHPTNRAREGGEH